MYYLPQLTADCALFTLSADQESWVGETQTIAFLKVLHNARLSVAMDNIVSPLACLSSGYLQQKFGPRNILLLTCVPYSLSWIGSALAGHLKSVTLLYLSR